MPDSAIFKDNTVDVDKVWTSLNKWGLYQKKQTAVTLLTIWSFCLHMLSIVFIGYRAEFQCREDDNVDNVTVNVDTNVTSSVWKEYDQCSIRTYTNISGILIVTESDCTNGWAFYDPEAFDKTRSLVSEWDLVCSREHLAEVSQTLLMVGQALGASFGTSLADRFGRKPVHVGNHVLLFVFGMATVFAPNYLVFAVLRILQGITLQGTALTAAILNLERYPTEIRFLMEIFGLLVWSTGISIITPLAYLTRQLSWRYLQAIITLMSSWSLIQWWLLDESLRWLIANGRVSEAKAIVLKACRINKRDFNTVVSASGFDKWEHEHSVIQNVEAMASLQPGEEFDKSVMAQPVIATRKYGFTDLIKSRRIFVTSLILWMAWCTNSLTYYGLMMISSSLAGDRFLSFFLGSVVEYVSVLAELLMINRFGRKPSVILFNCLCGVSLITATILTYVADGNVVMATVATALILVGKFSITASFSTFFLYTPELYPTNLRNLGIGLASTAARVGGMIAPFFRNLADRIPWGPGLICGVMSIVVTITLLFVPETNKYELPQTIEECEEWYRVNQFSFSLMRRRKRKYDVNPYNIELEAKS